jgi:5'-nucleotidase
MSNYKIAITNDDGIASPGLHAASESVTGFGHITIVAPSHQQTGMGRSLTGSRHATLEPVDYSIHGTAIPAYQCQCSPALVVRHSMKTIFKNDKPDLVISGINYGENLGTNVTCSGTVGAALEAACWGIPAIAISKQTDIAFHRSYTAQDWSVCSHFLNYFSRSLLEETILPDVDILKIDVPHDATPSTPWKITKLAKTSYYSRIIQKPTLKSRIDDGKTEIIFDSQSLDPETDIYVLAVDKMVSVTPLSADLTSRVNFTQLENMLNK